MKRAIYVVILTYVVCIFFCIPSYFTFTIKEVNVFVNGNYTDENELNFLNNLNLNQNFNSNLSIDKNKQFDNTMIELIALSHSSNYEYFRDRFKKSNHDKSKQSLNDEINLKQTTDKNQTDFFIKNVNRLNDDKDNTEDDDKDENNQDDNKDENNQDENNKDENEDEDKKFINANTLNNQIDKNGLFAGKLIGNLPNDKYLKQYQLELNRLSGLNYSQDEIEEIIHRNFGSVKVKIYLVCKL